MAPPPMMTISLSANRLTRRPLLLAGQVLRVPPQEVVESIPARVGQEPEAVTVSVGR